MQTVMKLLSENEGSPAIRFNEDGAGRYLFVCEHASRMIPKSLGTLGLEDEVLESHIAWDPGALNVAKLLAERFSSPLVYQRYSRLAYDCNRPPEAAGAMPQTSEVYRVPGNERLAADERQARVDEIYLPFHAAVSELIEKRRGLGLETVLVTVHSFTPIYFGKKRDVEVGILHDEDSRVADAMLAHAAECGDLDVRRNEPYGPADGVTHTLKMHGIAKSLPNVMIEIRNDLISNEKDCQTGADFVACLLSQVGAATV